MFFAICILKSFNSHISFVACKLFEFGTVSKWCIREWVQEDHSWEQWGKISNSTRCQNISHMYHTILPGAIFTNHSLKHSLSYSPNFCILTLYQTTNFRLFQTERLCRRQFKFDENGRKFFKQVENTVGKGEIARHEQFLLFPQCFQKACTADT